MAKLCTKCGGPGPFYPNKRGDSSARCCACILAHQKDRYASDPELRSRIRAYTTAWRATNRERQIASIRRCRLRADYGMTEEQFQQLFEQQEGLCAICSRLMVVSSKLGGFHAQQACVDHDHKTGKVRGMLCGYCNVGLGRFRDSPIALQNAIGYLGGSPCPQ